MPLPQVNDRLKEAPAQALRTLFATIGQLMVAADRLWARAAEQPSGSDEAPATPPSQQAPAKAPPAKAPRARASKQPAQDTGSARWRSLDKTGNVRLLDGDEEDIDTTPDAPSSAAASEPSAPARVTPVPPEADPAPPGYTPTEPVPAAPAAPAGPSCPRRPLRRPCPRPPLQKPCLHPPAEPALPPAPAEPAVSAAPADAAGEVLPVPNYDQLSVASLRARLRVLDATQVQTLLDYEKAHEGRPPVITMFERRLAKLSDGS